MKRAPSNEKMKLFMSDEVYSTKICPVCNSKTQNEYRSYMVAIEEKGKRDALMMGGKVGFFCPNCPVVVLETETIEEMIASYTQNEDFRYVVMGIVDMDAVPEDKRAVPLGDDDNPIPLIGVDIVSNRPQIQKERKVGRNDPCPCGSGKKYKKCCVGKNS